MEKAKSNPPKVAAEGEPLIKARVRPGNTYGKGDGAVAGSIVEVTARELKRVPHALISLEQEALEKQVAAQPKEKTPAQKMFRKFKNAAKASAQAQKQARAQQMREHLAMLGIEVK